MRVFAIVAGFFALVALAFALAPVLEHLTHNQFMRYCDWVDSKWK